MKKTNMDPQIAKNLDNLIGGAPKTPRARMDALNNLRDAFSGTTKRNPKMSGVPLQEGDYAFADGRMIRYKGGHAPNEEVTTTPDGKLTTSTKFDPSNVDIIKSTPKKKVKSKGKSGLGGFLELTPKPFDTVKVPESFAELADGLDAAAEGGRPKDQPASGGGESKAEGESAIPEADVAERWNTTMGEAKRILLKETDPKKIAQSFAQLMMGNIVADNQEASKIRKEQDEVQKQAENEVNKQIQEMESRVKERNEELAQRQKIVDNETREFQAAAKRGVNPDQYFENRSNFNTIIGAIAIGMGAYGSAMTGTPNYALDIIKDAIDRDVKAQLDNLRLRKESSEAGQSNLDSWSANSATQLQFVAAIKGQKIQSAKYFMEQMIPQGDKRIGDNDKLTAGIAEMNKWNLENVHLPKKDPMEQLKLQQALLNIRKTQQQIAQTHRDTTVGPAALSGIPFLKDAPSAYLSGGADAKKQLREASIEAKNSFARSTQLSKSIEQFRAMEAHTEYIDTATGGFRKVFGRAPKEWARLHNEMKRNAALMVQPVRKLLFDKDPRLSETDMKLIQGVANSKSVDSWHSMFARAGMNKLQILQDTAKVIAVDNMAQLYRRAASMIELPSSVRQKIDNLLKGDEFKTSIQKTEELYDFFKKAGL